MALLSKVTCYALVLAMMVGYLVICTHRASLQMETFSQRVTRLHTPESSEAIPVLLVAYLRSGSSWFGEITSKPNGAFYFFEPFMHMEGYYWKDTVCFTSGHCRKPLTEKETLQFLLSSLRNIYSCRFNALDIIIKRNLLRKEHPLPLNSLQKWCFSARHRVVKTIRVSMSVVDILLREMPTLKVVLLVRDPRGIVNSRKNCGKLPILLPLQSHVLDLCTRMSSDVTEVERLRTQYGDRVTMVMYEAMAEDPVSAARFIYNFSDMEFTPSVEKWIDIHSHANQSNSYYGTKRTDSLQVASQWRHQLAYSTVQVIDRICSNLYTSLGYLPITNAESMEDSTVKSRQPVNRPGFL